MLSESLNLRLERFGGQISLETKLSLEKSLETQLSLEETLKLLL